jgi:hypothetical protein
MEYRGGSCQRDHRGNGVHRLASHEIDVLIFGDGVARFISFHLNTIETFHVVRI